MVLTIQKPMACFRAFTDWSDGGKTRLMTGGSLVTTSQRAFFPEVPESSSSHAMFSLARTNMADDGESLESWLSKF